ncbi:MAG: VWA domain-containing protein [Acidobacteria bacterium]|nr:VWA domain-containing protein [Acidobacteriota bacterium]
MPQPPRRFLKSLLLACALAGCVPPAARARQQEPAHPREAPAAPSEQEETVRIESALIQTGVSVFDKSGKFVDGLRQEDFELTVEGNPTPVSFFERVAGVPSSSSSSTPAPGRGGAKGAEPDAVPLAAAVGRTVIIFADDLHLSFEDLKRARDIIKHFADKELTEEDTAAVVSSSGRLGFLQQFTDNPAVLRVAAERLADDSGRNQGERTEPPLSEYEALLIDRYDPEVTDDYASRIMAAGQAFDKDDAIQQARERARTVLFYAANHARATYQALEQVIRRAAQMPGRKVVLLVSDGFLLDTTNTDSSERLRRIYDAAARGNAVVYAFDARGLDAALPTSTARNAFRVQSGARFETQDPLNSIARGTGGRFVKNTNDLRPAVSQALAEASRYYLLAWRPDPESRGEEKFRRVEVKVKGRPELTVRLQTGYLPEGPKEAAQGEAKKVEAKSVNASATSATPPDPAQEELRAALNSPAPKTGLPTALALNYYQGETGPLVTTSLRVEGSALDFTREGDTLKANVDVAGAVYDSNGKAEASFGRHLAVSAPAARFEGGWEPNVSYNYEAKLAPGLHQVRVAARDVRTGRVGSASQWVEVPDLATRKLVLSSLLVAETRAEAARRLSEAAGAAGTGKPLEPAAAEISVDRRFERTSALRYLVFIYNARGGAAGPPDVTLQTQIFRGARPVFTSPPARVSVEGQDRARLAYAAQVPLEGLPPGRYSLLVTVNDRAAAGATATQRVGITIK